MKKRTKIMQNHVMPKSCKNHVMPRKKRAKRSVQHFFSAKPCEKGYSPRPYVQVYPGRMRGRAKKNWPRKKRMASWARQRQQITEAADGGARARTGADGAVVLNLRRGPGADGQLTWAGQHYYSHLGLRPPSKDFDYNQPLIREGPNDYILLRNGQKKLVRSLQGGEHRLTKLGKGFFRDKYYEYLVHAPVIIRGRRRSGRNAGAGYERRDWLPVNKLGGATRHPAHLTEEQVASLYTDRFPTATILQLQTQQSSSAQETTLSCEEFQVQNCSCSHGAAT